MKKLLLALLLPVVCLAIYLPCLAGPPVLPLFQQSSPYWQLRLFNQGLSPTWEAVAANRNHVISLQTNGVGTPTISRTTQQWCYDSVDQFYKQSAANEPCFRGRITGVAGSHIVYNTDASGIELADWGLQKDPPLTNLVIYSHDLSQASWVVVNTPVITYGVTGLDGAGSATTVEDNDTAVGDYVYQDVTLTAPLPPMVVRYWVKKEASATANALVSLDFKSAVNELHRASINLQTGAALVGTDNTGTLAYEINSKIINGEDWWEILLSATPSNTANTTVTFHSYPAYYDLDATTSSAANVGSTTVGNIELYANATIADIRGTAPIFTDAATVSTGAQTGPTYDSSNISDTSGAISFTAKTQCAGNLLATFAQHDGTNYLITDGTSSDTSAIATNTRFNGGIWWYGAEMGLCINGVCNAAVPYDGTILSGNLDILQSATCAGQMREVKGYKHGNKVMYEKQLIKDTQ